MRKDGAERNALAACLRACDAPNPGGNLPRAKAIEEFKRWLIVCGRSLSAIAPKTVQAMKHKKLLVPDGIADGSHLVAVRRTLSAKQLSDMKRWPELFGDEYETSHVWKYIEPTETTRRFEVVVSAQKRERTPSA